MRESESMVYAKMGVWERVPLRSHSLSFPFLLHMAGVAAVQPLPLLCAIRRSSPHEAGGGTIERAVNKSRHQGRTDHLSRSRWRRGLVKPAMLKQARGKPDQTRSIPRKGYICRPAVARDGGGPNERKRMAGYSPAASQTKDQG